MDRILLIDDEKAILDLLSVIFKKMGYQVETSLSAARALKLFEKEDFDLIISDIKMPEISGMQILKSVKKTNPDVPFIIITAYGTIKQAVEALKAGAMDYIVKPFDVEELKIIVEKGLEQVHLRKENVFLKKELKEKYSFENMIGKSKKIKEVFDLIEKIAGTDSTVIISGESGTGKEMVARAAHYLSRRKDKSFVSINCGALPENLLESELFGHAKGAFTGAVVQKRGLFEVAEKGTVLLDEVGEMSPMTQVKLLRALQDRKIRRVGGTQEIPVDVRIIAATNQNLKEKIKREEFREDLFYRLNVISMTVPPLRERKEDIPLLVTHFLKKYCQKMERRMKRITPEVMNVLEAHVWPGNVRELENVIERMVAIEERETITLGSLPAELTTPGQNETTEQEIKEGFDLNETIDQISRKYVRSALEETQGNQKKAAALLGINYRSLRYLIEKLGLKEKGAR